jgi:hypothetical protein
MDYLILSLVLAPLLVAVNARLGRLAGVRRSRQPQKG